jgi:hypothetical protein
MGRVLTPDRKGAIAETAIVAHAVRLGIDVYTPVAEGGRYDMIFDVHSQLLRVQCKWAVLAGDVVIIRCYSSRRTASGHLRRLYSADEIDAFASYCAELDRAFFLPIDSFTASAAIQLRLSPAKNNQKLGVNWASDFDFDAKLGGYGAIAQLGERLSGTQKVAGSSPAGSIAT